MLAMDCLKICHREFINIEFISEECFKADYKNKPYFIKKYNLESSDSRAKFQSVIKLSRSSISLPKIKLIDKKHGYVVKEYLEGTILFDYILDHDFDDNIYEQIFTNSYMARAIGLTLDFSLKNWMLVDNKLYYIDDYCDRYNPTNDFAKKYLSLWFFTKDLLKYYQNNGVLFDEKRIKEEFVVNKEMVLTTCKFYK